MFDLRDLCNLKSFVDDRGSLTVVESLNDAPFDIRRVYFIKNNVKSVPRGFHAHKKLHQLMVCVQGSCQIKVEARDRDFTYRLNSESIGLYLGPETWREMFNFSKDCILLVLASDHYDPEDYINSYDEFLELIHE